MILPKPHDKQCLVDDKCIVEDAEIGVSIGSYHTDVIHYFRYIEHRSYLIYFDEMQRGEDDGEIEKEVKNAMVEIEVEDTVVIIADS